MTNKQILVLGETGKTGRRMASQLQEHSFEARVASRSAKQRFDWYDDSTWEPALDGVDSVYIVDLVNEPVEWDAAVSVRAFCKLAVAGGVKRLVLLQARISEEVGGRSLIGRERAVQESGAEWTIMRPTWFAQHFSEGVLLDGIRAGEFRLPAGDGLLSLNMLDFTLMA